MVPIKVSTNTSASCRCCFIQLVIRLTSMARLYTMGRGRGRGMTDFTDGWTGGGGGSTDGSMAAAAFLFRNVKRP
jgi:hypothetical protein